MEPGGKGDKEKGQLVFKLSNFCAGKLRLSKAMIREEEWDTSLQISVDLHLFQHLADGMVRRSSTVQQFMRPVCQPNEGEKRRSTIGKDVVVVVAVVVGGGGVAIAAAAFLVATMC